MHGPDSFFQCRCKGSIDVHLGEADILKAHTYAATIPALASVKPTFCLLSVLPTELFFVDGVSSSFGAGESNPGSSKVTTFWLRDGVPWVISAKDVFKILATDWSVEECVSWLGEAGHCVFIASATASCTALEMEAERACILTAIRGCSVEVTAC